MLSVVAAAVIGSGCLLLGYAAYRGVRELAPPSAAVLVERLRELTAGEPLPTALWQSELETERRGAASSMTLLSMRPRAAARIALASGTACSLVALAQGLSEGLTRALVFSSACFAIGGSSAFLTAQLGRLASNERRRLCEDWQRRCKEVTQLLHTATPERSAP